MAAKKPNPAMEFIVKSLEANRGASYAEIAEAADKKKLKVYPIMFGRAQALLGIVKLSPRGQGKAKRAEKAAAKAAAGGAPAPVKRGPGRPRKVAAPAFDNSLEGIVAAVKHSEQAKARFQSALAKIHAIVAEALA